MTKQIVVAGSVGALTLAGGWLLLSLPALIFIVAGMASAAYIARNI